jgi:small subunit ribosomal protein S2
MPYVSHRWLGGLLTNFSTIEKRIERMHELRKLKEEGQLSLLPTKERMGMERELEKLEINLGGVSTMTRLPDAVFVADPKREAIATKEVNKLGLPLIGLVDTNCDPDEVDYLIPGNDDAIRSCGLIVRTLVRAVEEGRAKFQVSDFLAAEAAREAAQARAGSISEEGREGEGGSRARESRGRGGQGERRGGPSAGRPSRAGGSRPYSSDAPHAGREDSGGRPSQARGPRAPRPGGGTQRPGERSQAAGQSQAAERGDAVEPAEGTDRTDAGERPAEESLGGTGGEA